MADFVQQLQEHANNVCNILQEEIEWIERYKGYVDILSTWKEKPLGFRSPGELFPYITLSVAKQNCSVSERGKSKYFLRYLGQNVADILVSNKTGERFFSTKEYQNSNKKNFEYDIVHDNDNWHSKSGEIFRKFFNGYKERIDGSKRNEEHRIQNLLLRELAKKKGEEKYIKFIQPVRLQRCFLEIPTPFAASNHNPTYAAHRGGGIDILARVKYGPETRLGVVEVKDEYKTNENIFQVLNQAVTYACFICKLLRSESGAKWAKLFKFTNPEELLSKPLIVDAIAAMPNISPEDSALFNLEKPARIKVGEDLIELHFISFEDNKAENKLGNIKTSLRK
jgi:hypothetical protein